MKDTFVIKRSKWLRGDVKDSYLFRPKDGLMCCLGQISVQCGLSIDDISSLGEPSELAYPCTDKVPFLVQDNGWEDDGDISFTNSNLSNVAININDDETTSDADKEEKLIALFSSAGKTLVFED